MSYSMADSFSIKAKSYLVAGWHSCNTLLYHPIQWRCFNEEEDSLDQCLWLCHARGILCAMNNSYLCNVWLCHWMSAEASNFVLESWSLHLKVCHNMLLSKVLIGIMKFHYIFKICFLKCSQKLRFHMKQKMQHLTRFHQQVQNPSLFLSHWGLQF